MRLGTGVVFCNNRIVKPFVVLSLALFYPPFLIGYPMHADFCIDYTKSLLIGGKKHKTMLYFFVAK